MYGIYYNTLFDSLIIANNEDEVKDINNIENKDMIVLKTEEGFAGFNLFHVSEHLYLHHGFNSFNKEVIDYVNKRLAGIVDFEQDKQFVIGHVLECDEIEGTHLHKCKIDLGNNEIEQIVCGAKNIEKDQYVVVAKVGAWMPNGLHIVPGKLRGIDSNGMVCSSRELEIKDMGFNDDGIIVLSEDYANKLGNDFFNEIGK